MRVTGPRPNVLVPLVMAGAILISTCREDSGPTAPSLPGPNAPLLASTAQIPSVVLVGAGNIARCDRTGDQSTAALLTSITGTVFALGDGAYLPSAWQTCYTSTWGAQKARTLPALGNKDYDSSATASAYFAYWGAQGGDPTKGYYSQDLGAWHVIVLNSNTNFVSTAVGSPQEQWLKADLAANTQQCTIALFHTPRFYSTTSPTFSPNATVKPFWDDLAAAHADVIVNGHMRDYERFAPQTSAGVADAVNGIREFVIGTGGEGLDGANTLIIPNSQVNISGVYGVLQLTLADGSYSWQFIPVSMPSPTDAGNATCHRATSSGPLTPTVNAGPDLLAHPGDTVAVSTTLSDPLSTDAPWSYMIGWGDGTSTSGTTQSATSPIVAKHVYSGVGLDSARVVVTNSAGLSGRDSVAVQIQAVTTSNVLVGAGDIADCSGSGDSITANLLDGIPGTVFLAGDNAYPNGAPSDYTNCYTPTWGRHLARTRPVPGNHDYQTSGASGYYGYFGPAAGDPAKGYYSYDLGDWHIVALNSNIAHTAGSAQEQWLRADLAASPKRCSLAIWHHPPFTSGPLADTTTRALWQALYDYGAEVVVVGHEHYYERFAPQTAAGVADPAHGIREFVAGMGGAGLFSQATTHPANWETGNDNTFGVLKFTLTSTGYSWQFVHAAGKTYADSGSASCHDAPGAVNHPPTAAPGGPYTGTEGGAVAFNGSASSDPDGDALTYAWNFGDGTTGTGAAPTHTYADNGTYTVTLTVTDSKGAASAAVTTTATIANAVPVVTLPANQVATTGSAYGLSATFSDAGVNDAAWGYSINWGDGSTPTTGSATSQTGAITASHTYAVGGTDTVRVTVTDKDGAGGTAKTPVAVAVANRPPTAVPGGPYTSTEGSAVAFNGSGSSDPDGDAITYAWAFGDGTTGTGATPSHTYADNGSYTVSLTVTDSKGAASAAVTTTATVANAIPVITLPANQVATAGVAYSLSATFSDAGVNDSPWGYSIDWGDGSTPTTGSATSQAAAITASHAYAAGGTDTVRVTVTDKDGGAGAARTPVAVATVNHPPTAVAGGPHSGTEGAAVAFNGSGSSDPDGDAITYAWAFGDGTTGTGVTPSHTYADYGTYTVSLTVTDAKGAASAAATTTATIANAIPLVTLPVNQAATAGIAYSLSATFSDAGVNDSPWGYSIDWGDGSTPTTGSATGQTTVIAASHTYAAGGTDTVRVTVTDKDGGAGTAKTPVAVATVNNPPTAVAGGPHSGTEGAAVALNGSGSSDPDGDAITYAWAFGDGTTGTGATPSHTYADNGTYTVSLTVTDSKGAASAAVTTTATIANALPVVTVPANQAATAGVAYSLSATFSDAGVNDSPWGYSIDWGDGSAPTTGSAASQTTAIAASHTYAAGGTDTVRVTVTDKDGGAGVAKTPVTVAAVNHPPTAGVGGPYSGTEGAAVALNGSGSSDPDGDALTYAWTFGDGTTGTGATPSHTYADNGSYTVTLTVTDAKGAASTPATTTVTVANVAPTVSAPASLAANAGSPVTLSASFGDPGTRDSPWSYAINWGDGSAATTGSLASQAGISAAHTYAAAGTSTAAVTVTDKDGGVGSGLTVVTVSQQVASATLVGAGNIARCTNTNAQATAALVSAISGTVFNLGDNAYPNGTAANYQNCYGPTWGQFLANTHPVVGHHEYDSSTTAAAYFNYFGAAAGNPSQGYYSYDLGSWHIVVLNSNNTYVSTAAGSAQETWLKADLAASTKKCQLALFHHPRFYSTTSTSFFPTSSVKPFWDDLYAAGAELIINAHMQDYERFAPQSSAGTADPNGIREIIVGTGGSGLDSPNTLIIPNSEARISGVYGVLKLTLADGSYSWQFIPVAGQTATDSGSGSCH